MEGLSGVFISGNTAGNKMFYNGNSWPQAQKKTQTKQI